MSANTVAPPGRLRLSLSKIGTRLPIIMSLLVVVTILILGVANSFLTRQIITQAAAERLQTASVLKGKRVTSLLQDIDRDLWLRAADPNIANALIAFADAFESLENPTEVLRRVYITENKYPLGQKDLLVSADTGSSYGFIHNIYHPPLDALQDAMGYYDVFLFDLEGNLVYSVFKENDFATNMLTGEWKDSGLAESFVAAMQLSAEDPSAFIDFAPYAPSNFAPAAFIARPVFNTAGERLGVLTYQMPMGKLNASINDAEGLGETSDGFLVGVDRLMRSDSIRTEVDDTLNVVYDTPATTLGFAGQSGILDYIEPTGRYVMVYYAPLEFLGTKWVTIIQQDKEELYAGLPWALERLAGIAFATLLVLIAISVFFSRTIAGPIQKLTAAVREVAGGDYDVNIPEMERTDELGELSRAMEGFKQNAIEMAQLNEKQEAANKKVEAMAIEREKAAQRELEMTKEKEESDKKAAEAQEAMMIDLGKSFGTVVEAAISGEFSTRVEAKFSDQILNKLAEGVNQLLGAVEEGLSETGQVLARVAGGDLTQRMEGDFQGAFGNLQSNVNTMMDSLESLVSEISRSGDTLAFSSAELRDTAGILSTQTEQNAASLEETSAALDQLSASVKQVSSNVSDARKNAKAARDTAQVSVTIASDAASSMESIADASREIGRVIGLIEDISFQINLLALNAGVEAARAGDAGRGFSVVASEVRQLAQRASDASQEIASVITKSDAAVAVGVEKVGSAQASLEEIAQQVISISSGVDDVSVSVSEQVSVIDEITSSAGQIDQNTQKQAASFEELTAASGVLANEADVLRQSTARFEIREEQNVASIDRSTAPEPQPVRKVAAVGGGAIASNDGWDEF